MPSGSTSLWQPFSIPLDGSGDGSQEVGAPSLGYNWSGWVVMGAATAGQKVNVQVAGQVVAWGSSQTGPFAAGSGQTVTVTVTGGTPNSQLSGVLQGAVNVGNLPQLPPGAGSGTLVDIASGTVTVDAANVTIVGGQGGGINVSINQPPVELGTVQDSGTGTSGTFTVPAGTHGIGLTLTGQASNLAVTGFSTGVEYLPNLAAGASPIPPGYYVVPISSAADSEVTVTLKSYLGTETVYVSAILDSQAVAVQNSILSRLNLGSGYQGASGASVQTVREAPSLVVTGSASNVASGSFASGDLISGVSGQSIRLRQVYLWATSTTTGVNLEANLYNGSSNVAQSVLCGPPPSAFEFDFEGYALPSGDALRLYNPGSATTSYTWVITYDQY